MDIYMRTAATTKIFDHMSLLADSTRGRILLILEGQELTVSELCSVMQLPQSTVSRHLKSLADLGWVDSRKDGTKHLYRIMFNALDSSARSLWQLARQQVSVTASADQDARRLAGVLAERRHRSREFFDSAADKWDRLRDELFGQQSYLLSLLSLLDPEMVVADLGCGTGLVAELLAPVAARLIAIDDSEAMLNAARRRLEPYGNVELHHGQLESLPLEDEHVHAATLILVLHHLPDPAKVITEVARVLRPGGKLLIVDMLPHERAEYRHEMGHVWMGFGDKEIERYLQSAALQSRCFRSLPAEPAAKGPVLFAATALKPRTSNP
jgi:ArsR family transcriptional regulator